MLKMPLEPSDPILAINLREMYCKQNLGFQAPLSTITLPDRDRQLCTPEAAIVGEDSFTLIPNINRKLL